MKCLYDYTKDVKYKSFEQLVNNSLINLGFNINIFGTKLLKDLILYTYFNQDYDIYFDKIVLDFFAYRSITNISVNTASHRICYAIQNINNTKFKNNFYEILNVEYDYYFKTPKNLLILFITMLDIKIKSI